MGARVLAWASLPAAVAAALALVPSAGRSPGAYAGEPALELPEGYFRNTHAIVEGECLARRSFWDPRARLILTEYTFRADRIFLGASDPVVRVLQPGGVVPELDLGLEVSGSPSYSLGERAILFLWRSPRGEFRVNVNGPTVGSLPIRASGGRARGLAGGYPYEAAVAAIEARVRRGSAGASGRAR